MSTQVTLTANQSAYLSVDVQNQVFSYKKAETTVPIESDGVWISSSYRWYYKEAFLGFPTAPSEYLYRKIEGAELNAYMEIVDIANQNTDILCYPLKTKLDESSDSFPLSAATPVGQFNVPHTISPFSWRNLYVAPDYVKALINYGLSLSWTHQVEIDNSHSDKANIHSSRGANPPQLIVTFGDENALMTITSTAPVSGARLYQNSENTFSANTGVSGLCFGLPITASGIFRWRETESTEIHELPVAAGSSPRTVVPADTFTGTSIDYQFKLTSTSGNVVTSDWVTVSLLDTISSARAVSPTNTVVDGNSSMPFVWEHINESGAKQTKAELQISSDASTWSALATVPGSDTSCDVPAGSIASGTWYWRVRTYNLDGVAGSWSDPAMFMAISSPSTPIIIVTSSEPRPAIQWQTSEQEAYELELVGVLNTTAYGPEKTWLCNQYLSDGSYTVRVRSQNQYGLWSQWGESEIVVGNDPGEPFALTVSESHQAVLNWGGTGYDFYVVYRDYVPIAKTTEQVYIDRWSAGDVMYQVRGCYKDNANYGLSNDVRAEILPETIMVAPVDGAEWISLELSDAQHRTTKINMGREIANLKVSGRKYPAVELTGFYSHSVSVTCAFYNRQDCTQLEALLGRLVCVKTKDGDMAIGYISSMAKTAGQFYAVYDFDVPQIDFKEEIDLDTGDLL